MIVRSKILSCALILATFLHSASAFAAQDAISPMAAESARQELLNQQALVAWQRINEARVNPRAAIKRLGVSPEQARATLGDNAWILDEGLPPVALDRLLASAASLHGRDMFNRLYYSQVTPDGIGPAARIASAGYDAFASDESLGILVFSGFVDLKVAVNFMIDTMLRDELVGTPGVRPNIFSPEFSEVGIAFFAESIPLIEGAPYVYLFVLDFAAPTVPSPFLIGVFDSGTDRAPMMMPYATGQWSVQPVLGPGLFQVPYPSGGVAVVLAGDDPNVTSAPVFLYDEGNLNHRFVDLRALP